jgi:hypothetical protein
MSKNIITPSSIEHNLSQGHSQDKAEKIRSREVLDFLTKIPVLAFLNCKKLEISERENTIYFHTDNKQVIMTAYKVLLLGKWSGGFDVEFQCLAYDRNHRSSIDIAYTMNVNVEGNGKLHSLNLIELFREIYQLPENEVNILDLYKESYGCELTETFNDEVNLEKV